MKEKEFINLCFPKEILCVEENENNNFTPNEAEEEFKTIRINKKYNHISTDGKLLSDVWFDWVKEFSEGFAIVLNNGKYNVIGIDGKLLSDIWFDWVGTFYDGYAQAELNDVEYLIDTKGNLYDEDKNRI